MTDLPELKDVEVWVAMDSDGDYCTGEDRDTAIERYDENYGARLIRVFKMKTKARPPVEVEVDAANVPDKAGELVPLESE